MAPRNRLFFALIGLAGAIVAGCSGGGHGSSPSTSPPSSASPSPSPTGSSTTTTASPVASPLGTTTPFVLSTATPVAAETTPPTAPALTVTSRPLANGESFNYAGTTTQTFVYSGTNPNPSSTTTYAITQAVAVTSGATYDGATGLYDFKTTESDVAPLQTIGLTTNTYYALTAGPTGQSALTTYGYAQTDTTGQALGVTLTTPGYANNSGTVDLLPEARLPQWTNGVAETITQSESDGFSATRTYGANGTYAETATYPQTSAASPQPTPLTATITQNGDGSGLYSVPFLGEANVNINFAAPSASGLITITITDPTNANALLETDQASAWFAQPVALYSEVDRDNGAVTFPAACNVSATYGTQGNQVEQKYVRTDTILGTLEFFDQLTYVTPTYGAVCVQLSDVTYVYYDYSGQSNLGLSGVGFSGGNSPLVTQTVATTLGLSSETLVGSALRRQAAANASSYAFANARANFLITVEHMRAQRERAMFRHFQRALARLHR